MSEYFKDPVADNFFQASLKKVSVDLPKGVPSSLITRQLAAQNKLEQIHNKWKLSLSKGEATEYPYKDVMLAQRGFEDSLEDFFNRSPGYRHLFNQMHRQGQPQGG